MRIIYERKNRISTSFSVQNPVFVIYCQKFKTAENIWLAPKLRHSPTLSLLLSRFVFHSSREPTRICAFMQSFVRTTQKRTPKGAPAWCGRIFWLVPKLRHSPTLSLLLSRFVSHSSREPTRICAFKQSFVRTTQKRTPKGAPAWCGRRDLNPHGVTHRNLKPARLPISPRPHI